MQIANKEYSSKSELVNDLIRQARNQNSQIDLIRLKLDRAEKSGFTTDSKSEILKHSKSLLNGWIQIKQCCKGRFDQNPSLRR